MRGLGYSFLALLLGPWGVPWGLLWTPWAVWVNTTGGADCTCEVLAGWIRRTSQIRSQPLTRGSPAGVTGLTILASRFPRRRGRGPCFVSHRTASFGGVLAVLLATDGRASLHHPEDTDLADSGERRRATPEALPFDEFCRRRLVLRNIGNADWPLDVPDPHTKQPIIDRRRDNRD